MKQLLVSKETKKLIESKFKKSSYQKLKDKNDDLLEEIYALVYNENFAITESIKMKYNHIRDMEMMLWFGNKSNNGDGLNNSGESL